MLTYRANIYFNVIPKAAPLTTDPVAPNLKMLDAFYQKFSVHNKTAVDLFSE